jgi:transcriptional regulator with XRE-family HTH domain
MADDASREAALMLATGNQLRAARALLDMDQAALAERAGVDVALIAALEKQGPERLSAGRDLLRAIAAALESAGVELLDHGRPGVRLKSNQTSDPSDRLHAGSNDEWPEADA